MRTWQDVRDVTAAQRAEHLAARAAKRRPRPDSVEPGDVAPAGFFSGVPQEYLVAELIDLEHPRADGYGIGDRGEALTLAKQLSTLEAERASLTGHEPAAASDNRRRNARIREIDTQADSLQPEMHAKTLSWWPDKPPAGRTAVGQAARTGGQAPGPAPRAFLPK